MPRRRYLINEQIERDMAFQALRELEAFERRNRERAVAFLQKFKPIRLDTKRLLERRGYRVRRRNKG